MAKTKTNLLDSTGLHGIAFPAYGETWYDLETLVTVEIVTKKVRGGVVAGIVDLDGDICLAARRRTAAAATKDLISVLGGYWERARFFADDDAYNAAFPALATLAEDVREDLLDSAIQNAMDTAYEKGFKGDACWDAGRLLISANITYQLDERGIG